MKTRAFVEEVDDEIEKYFLQTFKICDFLGLEIKNKRLIQEYFDSKLLVN